MESWKVGKLGSWGVGELESWKEGFRYQVTGAKCFFLPSTFYLLQIPKWPLAGGDGQVAGETRQQVYRRFENRPVEGWLFPNPKPEIPNKFKTKTLRNQPRNTLKGNNVTGGNEPSITAPGSFYITARQVASSPDSSFSYHRPAEAVERVGELGSWKEGDRYQVTGGRTCQTDTCPLPFPVERVESGNTVPLFMLPGDGATGSSSDEKPCSPVMKRSRRS